MERIVLFLVLGAFLTGSMYAYNIQQNAKDADAALWSYQYQELARDAALAGLDRTVSALSQDAHAPWSSPDTYTRGETPHGNGSYQVYAHSVGGSHDTIDVYVVGVHGPDTMRIEARYLRSMDDHETPPAFRAVMVADNLELEGSDITVRSNASDRNASIHVNERLDMGAFDLDVHGYGTFSTPGGDAFDVNDFLPNVDYNGAEPNVLRIPAIPVPNARMDSSHAVLFHTGVFQFENTSGGVAFVSTDSLVAENCTSGDLPPASCQLGPDGRYLVGNSIPLVYFVHGRILLEDVQIEGNIVMYANGNGVTSGNPAITARGVVQGGNVDGTGRLLLRSPEPIHLDKDGAVRASVWSDSQIEIGDVGSSSFATTTPGFVGTLLARNLIFNLNAADDYDLTYLPPSPLVTAPGYRNNHPVGPRLIAYAEWDDITL